MLKQQEREKARYSKKKSIFRGEVPFLWKEDSFIKEKEPILSVSVQDVFRIDA